MSKLLKKIYIYSIAGMKSKWRFFAKLSPRPSSDWAVAGSMPSFPGQPASRMTFWKSTFQA